MKIRFLKETKTFEWKWSSWIKLKFLNEKRFYNEILKIVEQKSKSLNNFLFFNQDKLLNKYFSNA